MCHVLLYWRSVHRAIQDFSWLSRNISTHARCGGECLRYLTMGNPQMDKLKFKQTPLAAAGWGWLAVCSQTANLNFGKKRHLPPNQEEMPVRGGCLRPGTSATMFHSHTLAVEGGGGQHKPHRPLAAHIN